MDRLQRTPSAAARAAAVSLTPRSPEACRRRSVSCPSQRTISERASGGEYQTVGRNPASEIAVRVRAAMMR
jgi:hypothetical protein